MSNPLQDYNMADSSISSDSDDIELELSFESSSYDPNSGSDNEENTRTVGMCIQPYQFEPDASDSDDEQPVAVPLSVDDGGRLLTSDWCECGNCSIMPTAKECICCQELSQIRDKMASYSNDLPCIVNHPGFNIVCLDEYVLETAYFQYCQEYRLEPYNTNDEKEKVHQLQAASEVVLGFSRQDSTCATAILCSEKDSRNVPYRELYWFQRDNLDF